MALSLKDVLGEEYEKAFEAQKRKRVPTLNCTGVIKREIISTIRSKFKPGITQSMIAIGNNPYHLVMIETPKTIEEMPRAKFPSGTGEFINGIIWDNRKISLNSYDPELLDIIKPNNTYVLVGYMKVKPGSGNKQYYNLRVNGVITMTDIDEYNKSVSGIKEEELQ